MRLSKRIHNNGNEIIDCPAFELHLPVDFADHEGSGGRDLSLVDLGLEFDVQQHGEQGT